METVAIDAEWVETFKTISKEEINSQIEINKYDVSDDDEEQQIREQRIKRMMRMQPLFASQPRLEMICKDWSNDFVDSGFTSYAFRMIETTESFKNKEDDLKYLINLCGYNLTELQLYDYPSSQIMPLIKSKCFNLTKLVLRFKQVESKDFDNVFSNMSQLETLNIYWQCENVALPMTLIKSLEQVPETLKILGIVSEPERFSDPEDVPASSVTSVLSPETEALMTVISNMKNLESVTIKLDYGFTDEFFINLINNSKNLKLLNVRASNITDKGLIAVNNLHQLEYFDLGLIETDSENKFITDQSIQCLFNKEMSSLDISNCTQVTNSSIIELVKNLPNLQSLHIKNTKATIELVDEIAKLTKDRELSLIIWISFKINDDYIFKINPKVRFVSVLSN
ncbi:uncharacterized protein LOC122853964 [Aphidius gifuensis]|uniref:uncharacterized protein LOC122853964 n=1 Tax=Aphidius gifuensis TaxID=684658 RepID=UPI001CDB85C7|nr:uncharacterized protein LOC122853964 [Aphidius gifuensis]